MTVREMVKDMDRNTNVRIFYTVNGFVGYTSTKVSDINELYIDREVKKSKIKKEKVGGFASWQKSYTVEVVEITVK